jgi:roadblock/LC7 domain-containing protein
VAGRDSIDVVQKLPGVVTTLDVEDDRVVDHRGVADPDNLEIVLHFTGTWWELLGALLPVLGDALHATWTPGRWWACAGGDYVVLGRDGRAVLVEAPAAGAFLSALAGDGTVHGGRVW